MNKSPWICPACGCGNAPDTATCGQCIARQAFAPAPTALPIVPYKVQPFNPWPYPTVGDWPPWPGNGITYTVPPSMTVTWLGGCQ